MAYQSSWAEEIRLPSAGSATTDIDCSYGTLGVEEHGASGGRMGVRPMTNSDAGDQSHCVWWRHKRHYTLGFRVW